MMDAGNHCAVSGGSSLTKVLAGHRAPAFESDALNGPQFSLAEALKKGPVVAAFFKITCPVCQFAFPFLERLYKAYGDAAAFRGISQNDAYATAEFNDEYGITFPVLLDEEDANFPVSNLYGLTNVPTVLLIAPDGKVQVSFTGFDKGGFEKISADLAKMLGRKPAQVFQPEEVIPSYKPG
jgi:peroxiredoxin